MKYVKVGLSVAQKTMLEGLHPKKSAKKIKEFMEERFLVCLVYYFLEEGKLNWLCNVSCQPINFNEVKLEIDDCIVDWYKTKKTILSQLGIKAPSFPFFVRKLINYQLIILLNESPETVKALQHELHTRYRPDSSFTKSGLYVEQDYMIHPNPRFFDPRGESQES